MGGGRWLGRVVWQWRGRAGVSGGHPESASEARGLGREGAWANRAPQSHPGQVVPQFPFVLRAAAQPYWRKPDEGPRPPRRPDDAVRRPRAPGSACQACVRKSIHLFLMKSRLLDHRTQMTQKGKTSINDETKTTHGHMNGHAKPLPMVIQALPQGGVTELS